MSFRRLPATSVLTVVLTVAVSLLGVRLILPGSATSCAEAEADCCCGGTVESEEESGCGCSVSPDAPVPAAVLASVEGVVPPAFLAETAGARAVGARELLPAVRRAAPRARSAPTQALLETFRN